MQMAGLEALEELRGYGASASQPPNTPRPRPAGENIIRVEGSLSTLFYDRAFAVPISVGCSGPHGHCCSALKMARRVSAPGVATSRRCSAAATDAASAALAVAPS